MAGIAGINKPNEFDFVKKLLSKISHRGPGGSKIFSTANCTLGIIYPVSRTYTVNKPESIINSVKDERCDAHFAAASEKEGYPELSRDYPGVVPLYYGYSGDERFFFSSEIKSLTEFTNSVYELPPGSVFFRNQIKSVKTIPVPAKFTTDEPKVISDRLYRKIDEAVRKRINGGEFGCWLSGGLDSSIIAATADKYVKKLYTVAAGLKNSPDLEYARVMAELLGSNHFEVIPDFTEITAGLPDVIFHLESFDPLLVRSSIMNLLAGKRISDYTGQVFSGEGGDELFGGYLYLKEIPLKELQEELLRLIENLHNTALQRVDRCSSAFGLVAHLPLLDEDVVSYAISIPPELKISQGIEKWIFRDTFKKYLPGKILGRTKSKFWEGSGLGTLLAEYADKKISDYDFNTDKNLKNGYELRTKEEYLYYRLFQEQFGELHNFDFLGFSSI